MEFTISPSPSPAIVLSLYDRKRFPKFQALFEPTEKDGMWRLLVQPPEEAGRAVVVENQSTKDLTALRCRWVMTTATGKTTEHTSSSDSYQADIYHPVLKPQDRKLICFSTAVDESFLDHLARGGGGFAIGGGRRQLPSGTTSLRLEIEMLLFADGELAGAQTDKYALELQCRKPAAEFIAKQIRLAEAENRDITPVLSALNEMPYLRDDILAHWVRRYASYYLTHSSDEQKRAALRHLENRPALPEFYRRENSKD